MFAPKIRIDPVLLERARKRSEELGYPSVEEYVAHLLEQDLQKLTPAEDAAVQERLRGLGYL
ncbi:MAG: hypothetical protein KF760_19400 [Candidatus Eremiobacteraeota bacterium]|nr:hypothetical protein [Candidatus Eremiobacteraeota bacterium]MCW5868317.1 hypothetical protein [Candidatus Eremiobacteraeota bacterium]